MPYIGRSSNFGVRTRFLYTATASQTSFTGADTQNLTLSYSDSNFIDVHQNGVLLKVVDDYTATTGTSVVLATGATANDVIEITVYDVFSIANHIKKTGDAMAGTLAAQAITATTIGATGVVTANAGVVVDNITIDGTEIDLSSGDLTVDVAGNLILDADGGYVQFKDGGTEHLRIFTDNSGDVNFNSMVSDKDIHFHGNDGGSDVLALALDMSDAGAATFNSGITMGSSLAASGAPFTISNTSNGNNIDIKTTSSGSLVHALKIHSNGLLEAKQGVAIGGDGSANTLSDYEEGTWTPAFTNGTSLSVTNARYTKIGQLVYAGAYLSSVSIPNNGSAFYIEGLPFTVASSNMYHAGGAITYVGTFNITGIHLLSPTPSTGGTHVYFHSGSGTSNQIANSDLTGMTSFIFSVIYITDS